MLQRRSPTVPAQRLARNAVHLAAALAASSLGILSARADEYQFTGPTGTPAAPVTGAFSNNFANVTTPATGVTPASSIDTILDFGGSTTPSYTATNDLSLVLNKLVFNSTGTTGVTVTGAAGSVLNFSANGSAVNPTILMNSAGSATLGGTLLLSAPLTLSGTGTAAFNVSGFTGSNSLTIANPSVNITIGTNAAGFTGNFNLLGGTVVVNQNSSLGFGNINLGATSGAAASTIQFSSTNASSFTNAVNVQAGSSGNATLLVIAAGSRTLSGPITLNRNLIVNPRSQTLTLSGNISGTGSLSLANDSTSAAGNVVISGTNNTFSGGVTVNPSSRSLTVTVANDTGVGSGPLLLNPSSGQTAAMVFTSAAPTVGSLAGGASGTKTITLGTAGSATELIVGALNTSTTYTGSIAEASAAFAGSLTKVGTGTLKLTGTATYTGGTTVNNGTLEIGAADLLGNVTVNFNATSGTSVVKIDSGIASGIRDAATITLTGDGTRFGALALLNPGTEVVTGVNFAFADSFLDTSTGSNVTLSGLQTTGTFGAVGTAARYQNNDYFVAGSPGVLAVPEPTSLALLSLAAIPLTRRRRRVR